jgi:hypothetical protein
VQPLSLFCKSYRTDLFRIIRLVHSVELFNVEKVPFFISVPHNDIEIFKEHLEEYDVGILEDESILSRTGYATSLTLEALPGHITQQIVKSEYWRLNISSSYVCLDSDAFFIRPFRTTDFLWTDNIPYTVIDEAKEHLEACLTSGKDTVFDSYQLEAKTVQSLLDRPGRTYAFGPFPLVWHRDVWQSLEQRYLIPQGINLMQAIQKSPLESRWYGEALLKYQAIPLIPCQPFFKVYHYAWQLDRSSVSKEQLAKLYCGVIYQSSWERGMDWPREGGSWISRFARRLRRRLGRI